MVKKLSTKRSRVAKNVTIKHHHAKPYRRRHLGLLTFTLLGAIIVLGLLVQYRDQVISGVASSRSFISSLFAQKSSYESTISSLNGFALTYSAANLNSSALVGSTDSIYLGNELSTKRAYTVVRLAPAVPVNTQAESAQSGFTMTFHPEVASAAAPLETIALQDGGLDASKLNRLNSEKVTIDNTSFQYTKWQSKAIGISGSVTSEFATYSGLVGGHAVTIVIALGIDGASAALYQSVLESVTFNEVVSSALPVTPGYSAGSQSKLSLLDILMGTSFASAATTEVGASEKLAALYSPAVSRIYNFYCMDLLVDGTMYWEDSCSGVTGSGFFVSQDGYVATNGHVAVRNPQDLVIDDALAFYLIKGDARLLNSLLSLTDLTAAEVNAADTPAKKIAVMVDALYDLDSKRFTSQNAVSNLLVSTTKDKPDGEELSAKTKAHEEFSDANSVRATLVAYDYRAVDGYDGFRASDVAILKVDGQNYPVTKLGNINSVAQGASLSILGFPGEASDNSLVDSTATEATLTTGKVSAKKNAAGSDKMLIETDTTIGHGNSGGPALADDGTVVGIATYTLDGSGEGNGVYNYIRDIKDLTDLAASKNITFDTNSKTQAEWDKGMENFYTAHYSQAVKHFKTVLELYPNHSRAAEFIATSETRIANGEDIVDFPLIPVIIAAVVLLAGAGVAVFLIISHKKKHEIYNAGVSQGTVQPVGPDAAPQSVTVTPGSPTVESTTPPSLPDEPVTPPTPDEAPVTPPTPPATPSATPTADSTPAADPNEPKPFNPFQQ